MVDLARVDEIVALAPADEESVPLAAVEREAGDGQGLALRAGLKQDRARVAGKQDYEVRYESKKTGKSARAVTRRLRAMGIRDKPTAPASPWQNGFAERLIGSIRRECVDHIIVLGEMHLRRVLKSYADYYNSVRTHRSLNKDAPVTRQIQRIGSIKSHAILGGLHHHYARA
jgi:transposase InsO family protein